jgi:hypothetical protein
MFTSKESPLLHSLLMLEVFFGNISRALGCSPLWLPISGIEAGEEKLDLIR